MRIAFPGGSLYVEDRVTVSASCGCQLEIEEAALSEAVRATYRIVCSAHSTEVKTFGKHLTAGEPRADFRRMEVS